MRPLKELRVLEAAHELTLHVYRETMHFPPEERYSLTGQLRRAAYSIPLNIAEGTARGDAECRQFLKISLGSAAELEYGVLLARDLGYLSGEAYLALEAEITPVKKMLVTFIRKIDSQLASAKGQRPTANGREVPAR